MSLQGSHDPFVGTTLDERYRLDELIARGGMGAVYRGVQLSVNRAVAVKVIPRELMDESTVQRLMREAEALSGISHPNVVNFVDTGRSDGTTYLVMELIEGKPLSEFLDSADPGRTFVVDAMKQIASALAEIHAAGVIHRDLKPANVLVSTLADGALRLRVVDFGVVRLPDVRTLSDADVVLGTPQYMAPEQAYGRTIDARTDLFALGCIAYEMMSGAPPWDGASGLEIIGKICRLPHTPITEERWPTELWELVDSMLAKEPEGRPTSALEVLEALEQVAHRHGLGPARVAESSDLEALAHTRSTRVSSSFLQDTTAKSPPRDFVLNFGSRRTAIGVAVIMVLLATTALAFLVTLLMKDSPEPASIPEVTHSSEHSATGVPGDETAANEQPATDDEAATEDAPIAVDPPAPRHPVAESEEAITRAVPTEQVDEERPARDPKEKQAKRSERRPERNAKKRPKRPKKPDRRGQRKEPEEQVDPNLAEQLEWLHSESGE